MADLDFIYKRKSIRKFKDQEVPKEDLMEMLKAATYAPSAKNQQNWHFTVITNKDKIEEIAKVVADRHTEIADLAEEEKDRDNMNKFLKYYTVFKNAPVLVLFYAKSYKSIEYKILNDKPECKDLYDIAISSKSEIQTIGAAIENFLLAAANMGYGACYMTGPIHSKDKIYEIIGHDESEGELMALVPVGVPEDKEAPQPKRLPLEDVVTFID
ncbi:MAG: nitroreductase family protein [Intestinibacter sp.]|uniref:nitroreductase family protein n=1 Tax=Intestinibacter sp. TaxID=1965304 RepID=UPI002A83C338|nr:nitroreductase family protein [Intestinibacter sp.]MDY4575276.1 nitroreductase family protein [Intestinibacter sp.]